MEPITIALLAIAVGGTAMRSKANRGWEQDRRDNEYLSDRVDAMCGEIDRRYGTGDKRR